jgi:hypothetical protein
MNSWTARLVVTVALASAVALPVPGQAWNDVRTKDLVARATQRRARQLADSGLVDYTATAHGYLTFLAQLGEGFFLPPKVIKADELALEVYWRAPNHSKQWILGRRDTLLLPTDIQYHRDHLGIVQNNFPNIIRLGDGDEVQDVPHPLSAPGLVAYDFAISDSMRIGIPGREIEVIEVKVRPRDEQSPAAVGALYISREDAQVVRMAFSFTRTALRDKQLEDVSVILENSLIDGRFWLPRRQEIEIRRTGSWMDFPARGIIRGRWEIRNYAVNQGDTVIASAPGPEITLAPAPRRAAHAWPATAILDLLPDDVTLATNDDVRRVQEEARQLVRQQALTRARGTLPTARGFSDIARVNRAEGLALGAGVRSRFGGGVDASLAGRFGIADRQFKGSVALGWQRADGVSARLQAFRDYRSVEDEPEMSRAASSLAAQEFGSDYSDPMQVRGAALSLSRISPSGLVWRVEAGYESQSALEVKATPSFGSFAPALAAAPVEGPRFSLALERPRSPAFLESDVRVRIEARGARLRTTSGETRGERMSVGRIHASTEIAHLFGGPLFLRGAAGAVAPANEVPLQEAFALGGPITAPGYRFHELRAERFVSGRVEGRFRTPFPALPLGRFGRIPGSATVAPFVGAAWLDRVRTSAGSGWWPSAGLGWIGVFDLIRLDVARGLRDGRWRLTADISRDFWPIL